MAPPAKQQPNPCSAGPIISGVCGLVLIVAGILSGIMVPMYIEDGLSMILVCDKQSAGYDGFVSTRHSKTKTRVLNLVYNVTNAEEYLKGTASAEVVESGAYIYQKKSKRFDISFGTDDEGYETVSYKSWTQFTFDPELSCPGCSDNDQVYTMSIPYSAVLTGGLSEATLLLTSSCTTTQISNIGTKTACTAAERGTTADCACCVPGATCSQLVQPETSGAGALFSWIARNDRGVEVRSTTTALGISGVYSAIITKRSVREIMLGYASALSGYATVSVASDKTYSVTMASNFTSDFAYVCDAVCSDIFAGVTTFTAALPLTCDRLIPDTNAELAALLGISEDAVTPYSYLRQMSCAPFPFVYTSRLIAATTSADAECVDSSLSPTTDYCCLWSGTSALGITLKGMGCVGEIGGGLNERLMDTEEEAHTFTAGTDLYVQTMRTGCGSVMNDRSRENREAQTIVKYKQHTENIVWTGFEYSGNPNMTQLDVVATYASTGLQNIATKLPVEGAYGAGVYPKGLSADFFSADVSDGQPLTNSFKVFPVTTRRGVTFKYDKTVKVNGINGAKFSFDYTALHKTADNLAVGQGRPYKGNIAGFFYYQTSVVLHVPNYAYGDHYLLTQDDNTNHESSNTYGVNLYQTVEDYVSFNIRATPRLITSEILTGYEEDGSLLAYAVVEPATGFYIEGHNRIGTSFTVWECDPRITNMGFCKIMAGTGSCYTTSLGFPTPCSAANVMTPNLHGGKLIPIAYTDEYATISNDDADALVAAGEVVLYARIAMIVLCFLGLVLFGLTAYVYNSRRQAIGAGNKRRAVDVNVPVELAKIYGTDDKDML